MKILLFGGTTEGRVLAEQLAGLGVEVMVSVATEYGRELVGECPGLAVRTGRLDAQGMAAMLENFDLCVDATHPYAVEATRNMKAACERTGIPYRRCLRGKSADTGWHRTKTAVQAAELAESLDGNILVTTGAKELPAFQTISPERLYVRVLPSRESMSACEAIGLPKSHILAMQGPFSQKLNEALMEQWDIQVLVTKDGGAAGGFPEKCAAARALGISLVVIGRPEERGVSTAEILREVKERLS